MWFKSKTRNRRLGRERVLEVKMRSSKVREARIRMTALGLGSLFTVVLVLFLLWRGGDYALKRLVYENEAFAIRALDIETDGALPVEQIRRWAGLKIGENLFALDHARVRRELEMAPRVELASVQKILPGTVRIRVVERVPVARVNLPQPGPAGGIEMVPVELDASGWVMPPQPRPDPLVAGEVELPLPVFTGIAPSELRSGRRVESPRILSALRFLQAFDRSLMAGLVELQKVDLASPGVLVITTGEGSQITFSLADPDQQLLRWREIQELALRTNRAIATLDLAVTNYIPLTFTETAAAAPPIQKSPKPLKTRKKHV